MFLEKSVIPTPQNFCSAKKLITYQVKKTKHIKPHQLLNMSSLISLSLFLPLFLSVWENNMIINEKIFSKCTDAFEGPLGNSVS